MNRRILLTSAILFSATFGVLAGDAVATKKRLTLDGARAVLAAAVDEAQRQGAGGAIAVVDDGGQLLAFERLDETFSAAANVSIGKARTAAQFRRPTKFFEEIIAKGRTSMVALEGFTPLQGGIPVEVDGEVVGAIGVSGAASAAADEEIAAIGARALSVDKDLAKRDSTLSTPSTPEHLPKSIVDAAFAKGAPLIEVAEYKIHASRRDRPGQAEVHTRDTDIIWIVDGSATIVTGGEIVDAQAIGPEEIRGATIAGGEARKLSKGDVLVVPNGVPHWFRDVPGPLSYYVVKVTSPEPKGGRS
jgi:glc operon protein GlcG